MSQYNHRMSLVVPELLMPAANQLALIAGESADDVNTFTEANWQDSLGNKYSVCSTVIKPIVLSLLSTPLADSVLTFEGADLALAQQAMGSVVMYAEGVLAVSNKIIIGIDIEPHELFKLLGLTTIEANILRDVTIEPAAEPKV